MRAHDAQIRVTRDDGVELMGATSPEEVLSALKNGPPDCLVIGSRLSKSRVFALLDDLRTRPGLHRLPVILRLATIGFDTVKDFAEIRAKVLYVLCRSDALFPPSLMPGVMRDLAGAGVEARYFELDSDLGHSSSGPEHGKWSPTLHEFLAPLYARLA